MIPLASGTLLSDVAKGGLEELRETLEKQSHLFMKKLYNASQYPSVHIPKFVRFTCFIPGFISFYPPIHASLSPLK